MVSTGIASLDGLLGDDGYPNRSSILISGPPGIGKEALCYWFAKAGLEQGDFCIYATRLSVREVIQDQRAFAIGETLASPFWLAREGGDAKLDVYDPLGISNSIREVLRKNPNRRVRVILDSLSSSLMLNSPETIYKITDELIANVKQHDAILLATFEDGMHPPLVLPAMQQLFDGAIELSLHRLGLRIFPLLRIVKMRGIAPEPTYFRVAFTEAGLQLDRDRLELVSADNERSEKPILEPLEESTLLGFAGETGSVFNYLANSFVEDYVTGRLSIDQAGWRTRGLMADATHVTQISLYGKAGKFGPILKELLSKGAIEMRFFSGERGRGGEVVKFRIAYEKEVVKRFLDKLGRNPETRWS